MNDLFELVNGQWVKDHEIPADRGIDGAFYALRDKAEEDVCALLSDGAGRGGGIFQSFMDTAAVNAAGIEPLNRDLERLEVADIAELARNFGALEREGTGGPISFWVEKDSRSEESVAYLVQSGLGLPDEAYYREPQHAELLTQYRKHVATMLEFLGPAHLLGLPAAVAAERIVNMEIQIAASHWDVVRSRDAIATYNPVDFADLPPLIQEILRGARVDGGTIINMMPSYTEALAGMLRHLSG